MAATVMAAFAFAATAHDWTNEQREAFLLRAEVISTKTLSMGVTNSKKMTLSDGSFQHDAHFQTIDEYKARFESSRSSEMNFRDSFRYNIAAYELAKLLNLNMVPPSIERKIGGNTGAVTWWVDDVLMTELERHKTKRQAPNQSHWNKQMAVVQAFDQLIYNTDRNLGNLVITRDWSIWMIDHTRAFRWAKSCQNVKILKQVDRNFLASLRKLTRTMVDSSCGKYLTKPEIDGVMARRDAIVKHYDERVAQSGDDAVLYELARKN